MKILRYLAWGLAGTLGLLAMASAILFVVFDEAAIKQQLVAQMASKTGRQLAIDGELGLSVWPDVAVRLGPARLSEADGKTDFMTVQSARIGVAVLPLLSKQVKVQRVEIDGFSATLIKRKDGSMNIDDLAASQPAPAGEAKPDGAANGASPPLIDVAGLALTNARLSWRDEAVGKTTEIADLDLSTGGLSGDIAAGRYSVSHLKLATRGKLGSEQFSLAVEAPRLGWADGQPQGDSLTVAATLEGGVRKIVAQLALSELAGSTEAVQFRKFALMLDAAQGETRLKADLASPLTVHIKTKKISLDQFAGKLDLSSPALPMKSLKLPLAGRLAADLAAQQADLALNTQLDESTLALKLAVERFAPLALGFAIDIDRLNLDRYLPPSSHKTGEGQGGGSGPTQEAKIDLSPLQGLAVHGTLKVGQLQAHKLKLNGLDARLALAGGRLQVAPLKAKLYGGVLDGRIAVDAGTKQFSVRQNLQGIDVAPLLKDLADKDVLEGRGTVTVDVTTRGETRSALKRALAGQAALDLRDGAIKGLNLAKLLRDAKSTLTGKSALSGTTSATEKTDFSELTASFRIVDGVAHNNDLSLKSPFLRLGGEGAIDIGHDQLDYLAKVSVVGTSTGQEGKDLAQVKGVTIPLRLRGPYTQLSYSLELDTLLQEAAKTQLKEKAKEKLGNELMKLFGR